MVLVLWLDRGASVNVTFRERNVKVQSIKAAEARVRQLWSSTKLGSLFPHGLPFLSLKQRKVKGKQEMLTI